MRTEFEKEMLELSPIRNGRDSPENKMIDRIKSIEGFDVNERPDLIKKY